MGMVCLFLFGCWVGLFAADVDSDWPALAIALATLVVFFVFMVSGVVAWLG